MLYLLLITFVVFFLFWVGDLYLTIKTIKRLGHEGEINPIIRFILNGRGKLIYLFKPLELGAFLYLLWFINKFEGVISFTILIVFIFLYGMLVVNNAHVYYKSTGKESHAFKLIFVGLLICILFFIYLNYSLYNDLTVAYDVLEEKGSQVINRTAENQGINDQQTKVVRQLPELDLPVPRGNLK